MAQLRLGYPEIQKSGAEVLQVTHNTTVEAQRYFKHYPIAFPYLCDPDRAVHEAYGLAMEPASVKSVVASFAAATGDLLQHGEKTALPLPFMMRYGYKDSPQAVVFVDRDGVIGHIVQAAPNVELPSNAEILRRLAGLR